MTCRTLEEFYYVDSHTFEKQYKESLSGYRDWDQLEHADEWLLFSDNIGPRLAIDESSLSNGELYTFVTNRDARTRERSLVAVVAGTKSEDVIAVLLRVDEDKRNAVKEVTLDLSDSMRKIVRTAFPKAVVSLIGFISRSLPVTQFRNLESSTAGMPYNRPTMKWKKPRCAERTISRSDTLMATPARNCSFDHVICCSSQPIDGLTSRNNGQKYCLRNTRTYRRHTDYVILCA